MAYPFIKRYLIALSRHKLAGFLGFTVVMGLAGVAAVQPDPPPRYVAKGLLTYAAPPITLSQTSSALQQQGQALTEENLLSDAVVSAAVEQLRVERIPMSTADIRNNTKVLVEGGAEDRQNNGSSKGNDGQPMGSQFSPLRATILYQNPNERTARVTAKLLMDAMVRQSRQFNSLQINSILDNLNKLLPGVTQELREAEANLERYVRVEGPALQSARDGQIVGAITGSQEQQRQIRLGLEGINAQIRSLQSRLGMSADQAYASSALSADPIVADLQAKIYQVQTQIQLASQNLRADHPTMIELRNQQQVYEQLLQQRVGEVIGSNPGAPLASSDILRGSSLDPARQQLANTLVVLQTQQETLQQQLVALVNLERQLRREYANIPNKQIEQSRLEQQVALKRAFYDQVQARLADARLAAEETVGSLVVAQLPQTQLVAESSQNNLLILALGGAVGLLVGSGLVLLLDSLDSTFHTAQDLQTALRQRQVPVLGLLPNLPVLVGEEIPVLLEMDSPYLAAYERLRVSLRRATAGQALKVVVLTSTASYEGKTLTAYNLAIASARAGRRTLLIEGDLRSPSQAHQLHVMADPNILLDPVRYYKKAEFSQVPAVENLYILPSPGPQRQAAALLESDEMLRLLEDAHVAFDLTILDSPALSSYNDALLLEPYTDGIVLVTRPHYTETGLLSEAIEQFAESDEIQFLGAIINGSETPVKSSYSTEDSTEDFEPLRRIEEELKEEAEPKQSDRVSTRPRNLLGEG